MTEQDSKSTPLSVHWILPGIAAQWILPGTAAGDVYSNFLHLNWTLHDVRIRFGHIIPDPTSQPETLKWAVKEMAVVNMPWGQAKVLRDMLIALIDKFEHLNGEIKTPELPGKIG